MKVEQVLELVKAVSESDLTEFKYDEDGVKLSLKKTCDRIVPVAAPAPAPVAAPGVPGAWQRPAYRGRLRRLSLRLLFRRQRPRLPRQWLPRLRLWTVRMQRAHWQEIS